MCSWESRGNGLPGGKKLPRTRREARRESPPLPPPYPRGPAPPNHSWEPRSKAAPCATMAAQSSHPATHVSFTRSHGRSAQHRRAGRRERVLLMPALRPNELVTFLHLTPPFPPPLTYAGTRMTKRGRGGGRRRRQQGSRGVTGLAGSVESEQMLLIRSLVCVLRLPRPLYSVCGRASRVGPRQVGVPTRSEVPLG